MSQLVSDVSKEYKAVKGEYSQEVDDEEEREHFWHYLEEGIRFVNEKWNGVGDPVAIGSNRYFDREAEHFLCIRETYQRSEWNATLEDVAFEMKVDIEEWNSLLERKCKKYEIMWVKPAFQILIGGSG